jgi:putative heme transporter
MGLAGLLLWRLAGYVRIVVVPLSLALFPAAILVPVARRLEQHRWPPALAAITVLVVFLGVLVGIGTLVTMQIQEQLSGLLDQLQQRYEQVQEQLTAVPFLPDPGALFDGDGSDGDGVVGQAGAAIAVDAATAVVTIVTEFFLFLVASFFFIKDRRLIAGWLTSLLPEARRRDTERLRYEVWGTIGGYIRGQTLIALFDGVLVAIGLLILGIPLAIVLGVVVFFGAFVPTVGSIVAGTVAVVVALVTEGLVAAVVTAAIIVGVQQLEGNVLAPVVLGREVELHPLAVLCSIVVGASALGVWGAVIAVPLTASLYRVGGYIRANRSPPTEAV